MPPPNLTALTALDLGALPASTSQNVHDAGTTYTVWYFLDAPASAVVIGVFGFGDLVGYSPLTRVYVGPAAAPISVLGIAADNRPIQFPVLPTDTRYYLEFVTNSAVVTPALLTIAAEVALDNVIANGQIVINDDADGFPVAIIDSASGIVQSFDYPFVSGETGDSLDGIVAFGDEFASPNTFNIYSAIPPRLVLQTSTPYPYSGGSLRLRATNAGDKFYVGHSGSGLNTAEVTTLLRDGSFGPTTWGLAVNGVNAFAANNAETILYFVRSSTGTSVKRWDLVNNIALSDLVATTPGIGTAVDILVLADDTIVVLAFLTTGAREYTILHYDSAATLLHSYSLGTGWSSTKPRMCCGLENPDSFWVFGHDQLGNNLFMRVDTVTGAFLDSSTVPSYESGAFQPAATATPPERFGAAFSCPIVVLRAGVPPACPGEIIGERTDGLPYVPVVNDPCIGSGTVGSARTGT